MIRAALLFILLLRFLPAAEPEWPRFLGPHANPAVPDGNLPEQWSLTHNIEWKTEIPGRGWSSPIVSGKLVFLTTVTTDGQDKKPQIGVDYSNEYTAELMKQGLPAAEVRKRVTARDFELPDEVTVHYFLYCLDLDTGKVHWKREFYAGHPKGGRHRKNSFASETPVTDGQNIYVYTTNLGLWAFDLKGTQLWHTALETYPIYHDFGTAASPVLAGNRLIIVNDNEQQQFIGAFDKRTGARLWRTDRSTLSKDDRSRRSAWVTPFIWTRADRTEIVTVGSGQAISYDLEGKELWRLSGMTAGPVPSPYVYDGLLYINAGVNKGLFCVRPGATGDITPGPDGTSEYVVWSLGRGGTYLPTQVAYRGFLYVVSERGILSRYDAKTGKLSYRARIEGGVAFTSSPWAYNGKIFCINEEGRTFVLDTGEEYKLLATNDLDEMALATPAIVGSRLILRTATKLYSIRKIDPATASLQMKRRGPLGRASQPIN